MDEYLKREAVIDLITRRYENPEICTQEINSIPGADVAQVVHGRWVEYQIPPIICCSNCDWATGIEEKNFQYCPNCGARMDGGADSG